MTFYKSVDQLPPFEDYTMQGRTYRYFKGEPLYPFGFGLSYTKFKYDKLKLSAEKVKAGEELRITAEFPSGPWQESSGSFSSLEKNKACHLFSPANRCLSSTIVESESLNQASS